MTGQFSGPEFLGAGSGQVVVASSVALAFNVGTSPSGAVADADISGDGVLVLTGTSVENVLQVVMSTNKLAALHGALEARRERLPVDAGDQYDACRAEARTLWTKNVDAIFGPAEGAR